MVVLKLVLSIELADIQNEFLKIDSLNFIPVITFQGCPKFFIVKLWLLFY